MLYLYQSNRLEVLAKILAAQLASEPPPPLVAERLVAPHQGMARWLALRLAEENGICADVDFALPAGFIWRVLGGLVEARPEDNRFDPNILIWSILRHLPDYATHPDFAEVGHYLEQGSPRNHYQLAQRLARVLDRYLVYRPDWIQRWEAGRPATDGDAWQAELWRAIAGAEPHHWVRLGERLKQAVETGNPPALPRRISLFGVSNLSPGYLEIVELLSRVTDIHLYLLNPSEGYWGDLAKAGQHREEVADADEDAPYPEPGNPLLASLGKQGQQLVTATAAMNPADGADSFIPNPRGDLLGRLQNDILHLRDGRDPPLPFPEGDDSLRVHSCHGPMREVEVLYDQLLDLFERHPELQPDQVMVMTPDMDRYAPLIEAVFDEPGDRPPIPYSLADRPPDQSAAMIDTFFRLFELPRQRFALDKAVEILETPAVARRFGLDEESLPRAIRWLHDAGIRWGRDAEHRRRLGLPPEHRNSWRAGLERMLLGYAMADDGPRLFAGIRPYDEVEGASGALLGGLLSFSEAIFELETLTETETTPERWLAILLQRIDRFFAPDPSDDNETQQLQALRDALESWRDQTRLAGYHRPCALEMLLPHLRGQIEGNPGNRRFLAGGVTFCALTPNRMLPAEVIGLLGMNDDRFPRDEHPPGFDLLTRHWRFGDRSARLEDRYLFLETLISARRGLLITYTGQDIRDNTSRPPSVVISELLDYLDGCYLVDDKHKARDRLVIQHPLQPFSVRYFNDEAGLFSYSPSLRQAAAHSRGEPPKPLFSQPLPDPEPIDDWLRIDLRELAWFIANPARWFVTRRLGLASPGAQGQLESREPIQLDRFDALDLDRRLVTKHLQGWPMARIAAAEEAAQTLPHGTWGRMLLEESAQQAERFVAELEGEALDDTLPPLPFDFRHGEVHLTDTLHGFGQHGITEIAINAPWYNQELELWLRHLILNRFGPAMLDKGSRIIHPEGVFSLTPVERPDEHLNQLLALYRQALNAPPPFPPKSARAYILKQRQGKPLETCLAAARQSWLGNDFYPGEYFQKPCFGQLYPPDLARDEAFFDETFMEVADQVWGALYRHVME